MVARMQGLLLQSFVDGPDCPNISSPVPAWPRLPAHDCRLNFSLPTLVGALPTDLSGFTGGVGGVLWLIREVADTLPGPKPQLGWRAFASPTSEGACTLPTGRSTQLLHFSETQLFLLQAGALLGYLAVQLVATG
jgi:hypothetical protein